MLSTYIVLYIFILAIFDHQTQRTVRHVYLYKYIYDTFIRTASLPFLICYLRDLSQIMINRTQYTKLLQ